MAIGTSVQGVGLLARWFLGRSCRSVQGLQEGGDVVSRLDGEGDDAGVVTCVEKVEGGVHIVGELGLGVPRATDHLLEVADHTSAPLGGDCRPVEAPVGSQRARICRIVASRTVAGSGCFMSRWLRWR